VIIHYSVLILYMPRGTAGVRGGRAGRGPARPGRSPGEGWHACGQACSDSPRSTAMKNRQGLAPASRTALLDHTSKQLEFAIRFPAQRIRRCRMQCAVCKDTVNMKKLHCITTYYIVLLSIRRSKRQPPLQGQASLLMLLAVKRVLCRISLK
jgi:hypothetical protein